MLHLLSGYQTWQWTIPHLFHLWIHPSHYATFDCRTGPGGPGAPGLEAKLSSVWRRKFYLHSLS